MTTIKSAPTAPIAFRDWMQRYGLARVNRRVRAPRAHYAARSWLARLLGIGERTTF